LLLESYLYGLINKESLPKWPQEMKKAQAVAARTYAIYRKINRPRELCDLSNSNLDQVYGGYLSEDHAARRAVDETRGQVLTYNNRVAVTYFHSTCGGHTSSSEAIWGSAQPHLPGVKCPYCQSAPDYRWEFSMPYADFGRALGVPKKVKDNFSFEILSRDQNGRVLRAKVKYQDSELTMRGEEIRQKVGFYTLKSTDFQFTIQDGEITFSGSGLGHGVGMCQWGAAEMAKRGSNYKEILNFYYPGTVVKSLY